jgi:enoyl-CoA hydratase/carnithine racemase
MTEAPYRALTLERAGRIATVRMHPVSESFAMTPTAELHQEMGLVLSELRNDDSVHLVILTGAQDGQFTVPPSTASYRSGGQQGGRLADGSAEWLRGTGVIRTHQTLAEMEKPVIAAVNGDAFGFGSSLMFNSDLIVAREDARICDMHLALGTLMPTWGDEPVGPAFNMFPGDGGLSVVPLYMSPAKTKEYLMLAKAYTAREMADAGWINYAVPAADLAAKVDELAEALLARSPEVIAYTKRVANRALVEHLNRTLDAGVAYEHVSIREWLTTGR